jgi:transposase
MQLFGRLNWTWNRLGRFGSFWAEWNHHRRLSIRLFFWRAEATEPTLHRDWCPACRKQVEPKVPDALPQCTLGSRTPALTAWLFSGLATTLSQIVEVFNHHLQMKITAGDLMQMWHRLAEVLLRWYKQIRACGLDAGVLRADETGWRVEGQT